MKNYLGLVLLIIVCSCESPGQKMLHDSDAKLELKILDKELVLSPGDEWLALNVSITNKSDTSFLLYGFKSPEPGSTPVERLMQPNWTAVNGVFTFRGDVLLPVFIIQPLPGVGLPQSMDTLIHIKDLKERHGNRMYEEKLILKKHETWSGKLRVHVNKKRLLHQKYYEEKGGIKISGESEIFLIYSCGVNIINLISEERIKKDEKVNEAVLFQGYVRSSSTKLVIKDR